jgi:hypothetical protein
VDLAGAVRTWHKAVDRTGTKLTKRSLRSAKRWPKSPPSSSVAGVPSSAPNPVRHHA